MTNSTDFTLSDFCAHPVDGSSLLVQEHLDEDGNVISFVDQAAFVTHYLHLRDSATNIPYAQIAEGILHSWMHALHPEKMGDLQAGSVLREPSAAAIQQAFPNIYDIPFPAPEHPKFTFIDLFAGIGGFRVAFQNLGGECVFSSEWDEQAKKTYYANFGDVPFGDITKESTKRRIPASFDVLCAGFPCQPFSISGKQKGFEDTRGTLFFDICQIIHDHNPRVVLLENVKHLIHHDGGKTFQTILDKLAGLGYQVVWSILNGADFGVPQNRERTIIVASKGKPLDFTKLHIQARHPMKEYLDRSGKFDYLSPSEYTLIDSPHRQPDSGLIFAGYRNKSIRKVGVRPGTEHLSRVHKQPNRIYSVDGLHPTLPSQESSGRFFILTEDNRVRKLTISECWRLMGFPDKYLKVSAIGQQYKQLGNSVCIPMIEALAQQINEQLL